MGGISNRNDNEDDHKIELEGKDKKDAVRRFWSKEMEKKFKFEQIEDIKNLNDLKNYGLLPTSVIHHILLYLPPRDHLSACLTSKLFFTIGNTKFFWEHYTLNRFGMEMVERLKRTGKCPIPMNWKQMFFRACGSYIIRSEEYYKRHYFTPKYQTGDENPDDHPLKVAIVGPLGCGKSSLVLRFVRNQFFENFESTIGAAFLSDSVGGTKLELWDTAGHERFVTLMPMYMRQADFCIFTFDVCCGFNRDKKYLEEFWVEKVKENLGMMKNQFVLLVGLKSDLEDKRKISYQEGLEMAGKHDFLGYVEASSKTKMNVDLIFGIIVDFLRPKLKKK